MLGSLTRLINANVIITLRMTKRIKSKPLHFKVRSHKVTVLLDKILIFRLLRSLHGRFWGVAFILIILTGLYVCFAIKPSLLSWSTAFSYFGNDIRTAPYFSGTMFFGAYALWRWRNYLSKTLKHPGPILVLITLTIIGFYLVALMPVNWKIWPSRIHFAGVILIGISIATTVVADTLLSKTRHNQQTLQWRALRLIAFASIVIGGYITYGSASNIGWFNSSLIGELLLFFGYSIWIIIKTYQGEVNRSYISKQLRSFVVID